MGRRIGDESFRLTIVVERKLVDEIDRLVKRSQAAGWTLTRSTIARRALDLGVGIIQGENIVGGVR